MVPHPRPLESAWGYLPSGKHPPWKEPGKQLLVVAVMMMTGLCVTESESESCSVVSNSLWPHRLYSPWNSLSQNTGVDSLSLLQGIFPAQESNWGLPYCRQILYQLSYQGSPMCDGPMFNYLPGSNFLKSPPPLHQWLSDLEMPHFPGLSPLPLLTFSNLVFQMIPSFQEETPSKVTLSPVGHTL